ncbi:hypothetical protein RN001_006582 [Aquatica leii]|uniref:Acyltransferase 3 domain-containing protein n=1 Tax=Aquatica leii TaxID=1421715 RepID=A0AAN7QL25_9COLE|nr:hypothetical protein RN001_006582 [Aquatica leii]
MCRYNHWYVSVLEANGEVLLENEDSKRKLNPFDDCINTNKTIENKILLGKYCLSSTNFESYNFLHFNKFSLSNGTCVPDECTISDIITIFNSTRITFWTTDTLCQTKEVEPYDRIALATIAFFGVLFSVVIASSLYDAILHYLHEEPAHYLLTSFSLLTNGKKILQVDNSQSFDQISCMNGIRVISLILIIILHTFITSIQFIQNISYYQEWCQSIYGTFLIGGFFSVDTFLVLTGLLISFNAMKLITRKQKFHVIKYYINRYFRISSVFFVSVLISLSLIHLSSGPLWKANAQYHQFACSTNWWNTLLYIENIMNMETMCIGISWYLCLDVQLCIISPILIIPLKTKPKIVLMFSALLGIFSIISVFGLVWFYRGVSEEIYQFKIYTHSLVKASPWFFGLITGYYLFISKKSKLKINKIWANILSTMSIIGFIICIYENKFYTFDDEHILENSFRLIIIHSLFSLCVCWFVYACDNGYFKLINKFLSLPVFEILSKLSYSAFIIHYMVLNFIVFSWKRPIIFSAFERLIYSFWNIVITMVFALIATLTIEMPVVTIIKFLLSKKIKKS